MATRKTPGSSRSIHCFYCKEILDDKEAYDIHIEDVHLKYMREDKNGTRSDQSN